MDSGTAHVTSYILTYSQYFRKTKPQVRTDRTNHSCHLTSRSYKLGSTRIVPLWQSQWSLTTLQRKPHFTGEKLKFQARDASLRVTGLSRAEFLSQPVLLVVLTALWHSDGETEALQLPRERGLAFVGPAVCDVCSGSF